jgi:hypothetical protein
MKDPIIGREVSDKERKDLVKKGWALPDGSYPIANASDLHNAIEAFGRKPTPETKAHIIKRAKALGKTDMLPADWDGSTKKADEPTAGDVHVDGILNSKQKKKPSRKYLKQVYDEMKRICAASGRGGGISMSKQEFMDMGKRIGRKMGGGSKRAAAGDSMTCHEAAEICAHGREWRLFNELHKFATPPDWFAFLPVPGTYRHAEYGNIRITRDRNQRFVDNFKGGVYQKQLPIDAEHQSKLSGAVGHIVDMRLNEDGSVEARPDWNSRGVALIEGDRYKYFSPEFYDSWTDPATDKTYKDVAIGGALTTRPFFKEPALRALVASERGLDALDKDHKEFSDATALEPLSSSNSKEGGRMPEANDKAKKARERKSPAKKVNQARKMAESAHVSVRRVAKATKKLAEGAIEERQHSKKLGEKVKSLTEQLEESGNTNKQLTERIATLEKNDRTKRFSEIAQGWPEAPEHVKFLESVADKFGEDSEEFKGYVKRQKATAEQLRKGKLFSELGRDGSGSSDSADVQVLAKARALIEKDSKLSMQEAMNLVFSENQELYEQYRKNASIRV